MEMIRLWWLLLLVLAKGACAEVVVFESTETPPFWSASLPEDGDAGRLLGILSRAAGIAYSIEYVPVKRFTRSHASCIVGTPDVLADPGGRAIFPIAVFNSAFFFYRPHHDVIESGSLANFRGHTMGVLRGTLEDKAGFERNGIRIEESDSIDSLLRKLRRGRIDFSILIEASGRYDIDRLFPGEVGHFATVEIPGTARPIAVMIDKTSPQGRAIAARYRKVLDGVIRGPAYRDALARIYGAGRVETVLRQIDRFVGEYRNTWGE